MAEHILSIHGTVTTWGQLRLLEETRRDMDWIVDGEHPTDRNPLLDVFVEAKGAFEDGLRIGDFAVCHAPIDDMVRSGLKVGLWTEADGDGCEQKEFWFLNEAGEVDSLIIKYLDGFPAIRIDTLKECVDDPAAMQRLIAGRSPPEWRKDPLTIDLALFTAWRMTGEIPEEAEQAA